MQTFETYRGLDPYAINQLIEKEPVCWNGIVRVRKYKVTVELIDEPLEVIHTRLRKLWDANKNHHNNLPLLTEARKYGLSLE